MNAAHTDGAPRARRIREDVWDGVRVMAFSCVASSCTAVGLLLLARLAG